MLQKLLFWLKYEEVCNEKGCALLNYNVHCYKIQMLFINFDVAKLVMLNMVVTILFLSLHHLEIFRFLQIVECSV
jgi:hypothetical protein